MRQGWLNGCLLLCCAAFVAHSQTVASAPHQITLAVFAADKSGHPVSGLQQQDFTLSDNKLPRPLTNFRAVQGPGMDLPVEVVLVVDEVNDSFNNVAFERDQLKKLFQTEDGELPFPVSLVFFTDSGAKIGTQASRDSKALIALLNQEKNPQRTIRRSQGIYGADQRLQLSLRALEEITAYETPRPGRKLVVWISPGWPLLDLPNQDLTSKMRQQIFSTAVDLSAKLRMANITLDSVDPLGTSDAVGFRTILYKQFLKGIKNPSQAQFGNLGLPVLAFQSGGRVLNSNNNVAGEVKQCMSDGKSFYLLSFEAAAADGPDEYHALEVKINQPGLTTRTTTGYYAQPEAAHTR